MKTWCATCKAQRDVEIVDKTMYDTKVFCEVCEKTWSLKTEGQEFVSKATPVTVGVVLTTIFGVVVAAFFPNQKKNHNKFW